MKNLNQTSGLSKEIAKVYKDIASWTGFEDIYPSSKKPSTLDIKDALTYPAVRTIIKLLMLPILSCKVSLRGDNENQKKLLEKFFHLFFRRISKQVLFKTYAWGFCVGEKIYKPIKIEGKTYLILASAVIPEPYNCVLKFEEDPYLRISGFDYWGIEIERERMIYFAREGDPISQPKGISVIEDIWWAIDLIFKDWTLYQVYKKFKSFPYLLVYYIPKQVQDESGSIQDLAKKEALDLIKNSKQALGFAIPKIQDESGKWIKGWEVEELKMQERTTAFLDSIQKLESLMFMGALIPKRILEQDMKVGSYALAETQSDFFIEFTLTSMLEEFEEYLREWVIFPMLEDNFGSIEVEFDLNFGDRTLEVFRELVIAGIKLGLTTPDFKEMMKALKIPTLEEEKETEIETERKKFTFARVQDEARKLLRQKAEEWAKKINAEVEKIKIAYYDELLKDLKKQYGKIALKVKNLFKSNPNPSPNEIAKIVQIPNKVFSNIYPYLLKAWEVGMKLVCKDAKEEPFKEPSLEYKKELRKLALIWEGREDITGEGDLLERRLYSTLMTSKSDTALNDIDREFDRYINQILPNRIIDPIHEATQIGIKDALYQLKLKKFKTLKG